MSINASTDTINATITCLPKHFDSVLSIFKEVLCEPMFPEEELQNFITRRVENLKMDLVKGDIVSYRQLTEELYGINHAYGYNSSAELYKSVKNDDLKKHFSQFIVAQNCYAFIAGDVNIHHRQSLDRMLDSLNKGSKAVAPLLTNLNPNGNRRQKLHIEGNLSQTSIKIGRKLFNRKHPDYPVLTFVSTLLGGYFSSRLISNIREKKGLTYGIYSMLDTLLFDGAFIISTEVANKNVDLCIKEIYKEFDILQNAKVNANEMRLVKNYLAGNYLNFFDGPFNSLRAIKSLVLSDIPLKELKSLVNISQSITPEQVLDISQKYLDRNDFWEVIVGTSTS
jgi:predicted Zn-dependent peptidase